MAQERDAQGRVLINWNRPMLKRFKTAYDQAVKTSQADFTFEGNQFVVGYAKYLIEYLDGQLPKTR